MAVALTHSSQSVHGLFAGGPHHGAMTRTRTLRIGMVTLAVALLATGCGRRDRDDTATTEPATVETSTTAADEVDGMELESSTTTDDATTSTTTTTTNDPEPVPTAAPATTVVATSDVSADLDAIEATLAGITALDTEAGDAVAQTDAALAHDDTAS